MSLQANLALKHFGESLPQHEQQRLAEIFLCHTRETWQNAEGADAEGACVRSV